MPRFAGMLLLLVCSAGCRAHRSSTPLPGRGDLDGAQNQYQVEARWSLEVGTMSGFSSLGRDPGGALWSTPENGEFLVPVELTSGAPGVAGPALGIAGVPPGWDVESLAWLEDGRVALGTETQEDGRTQDAVLIARRQGNSLRVEDRILLPYGLWNMRARRNRGIEGLCRVGRHLVAGVESVWQHEGRRLAPVAVYDLAAETWSPLSVELTTPTGRLSAVACRPIPMAASGRTSARPEVAALEVLAIERHFEVARIVRFEIPPGRPAGPSPSIRVDVVADLTTLLEDRPNPEGIELYAGTDRLVVMIDNNYGGIRGPTEVLVLRRVPQR